MNAEKTETKPAEKKLSAENKKHRERQRAARRLAKRTFDLPADAKLERPWNGRTRRAEATMGRKAGERVPRVQRRQVVPVSPKTQRDPKVERARIVAEARRKELSSLAGQTFAAPPGFAPELVGGTIVDGPRVEVP